MALIDIDKQFDVIKKAALDAVRSIFPVSKKIHTLKLDNVWTEVEKADTDYQNQAKIKARGGSWGINVYAALSLIDKQTNRPIDHEKKIKLFLLPKLTPRASYIVKGNEYQVANQLRLKPGAYVKQTKSGNFKTQINLSKGGIKPDIIINNKGIVQLSIHQGTIDMLPLLKGVGLSDNDIKSAWGKRVYDHNLESRTTTRAALQKFSEKILKKKFTDIETAKENIAIFMKEKTKISPQMTKLTLGREHHAMSPELLLDASTKLIKVTAGQEEMDDVDNLAYKEFFGVDDSIKERIEKNKAGLVYRISRNLDSRTKIKEIISINTFGNLVETFFTEDDRSATTEQINPLHMFSGHEKVTYLGPGALSNVQTATDETRDVHPTHLNFIDPVHTPESDKIGLNLGLALTAQKDGTDLKATFYDVKQQKGVSLTPLQVYDKILAFPEAWDAKNRAFKSKTVKAQHKGKLITVDKSKVDYIMPFAQYAFSLSTNLIPYMANDNGNRTMMAGKHMEQAIALKEREAPLVQSIVPNLANKTFEEAVGESFAVYATENGAPKGPPINGTVKSISKDHIVIQSGRKIYKLNLYHNFTLNQKTFLNHEVRVSVGDKVKGGQLLADSNHTQDGILSLGRNLKTAYIPYKGYNFEDGIVITESAAKKLTSEHIHQKEASLYSSTIKNLSKFRAIFPNTISLENLKKLDQDGVIKKGAKVELGDIVIALLDDTGSISGLEAIKAKFDKSLGRRYKAKTSTWDSSYTGTVVNVHKDSERIVAYIKTSEPATIGDKLAGRHGNKGIITKVIPDAKAPTNKEGESVDIMLNPHGVISRINIGQMFESAASKAAKKQGKVIKVDNFSGENYLQSVKDELKKAKISDTEELFDPDLGKSLGQVHVGDPYILKLNKQSTVNFSARGESGPVQTRTLQPSRGGSEGAKAVDLLTLYSMLAHGAKANLKEMSTYKSENNPELWEAIKYGKPIPAPTVPYVFTKLINMLKAAGVDVQKKGTQLHLAPLTDEQIQKLSKMEITNPAFYRTSGSKIELEKGGFLDPTYIGGPDSDKWAHINLRETIPNPTFEKAIKILLDIVDSKFQAIMSGEQYITINGKKLTAGDAFKALLDQIDVDQEIQKLEAQLTTAKGATLDKVIKKYRILMALKKNNLTPTEAYLKNKVAVIPPKFRTIAPMESGDLAVDDSNWLYRNIAVINKHMQSPVVKLMGDQDLKDVRQELYKNMKALSGLDSVKVGYSDKAGFIKEIHGEQPKTGFYQYKVLRKNQNLVGRGTIIPEPRLHMDEVSLPNDMAWKIYGPFVIKELVRSGMSALQAQKDLEDRTARAKRALDIAMSSRPVMLNRAPSLHKFSMMAFNPKITRGKAIKIPPLVVSGYNADFNGDSLHKNSIVWVEFRDDATNTDSIFCTTAVDLFEQITDKKMHNMIEDAKGYTAIYEIPLGKVRTLGIVDGKIIKTDIQRLTVHTSHGPCYQVKTHTGTSGIFSEHHNFSYINNEMLLTAIKTEDMPSNVLLPKVNLEYAWENVCKYQMSTISDNDVIIDEDFAYVLGFFAGDGHVSDRRNSGRGIEIGFTDTEGTLLDAIESILSRYRLQPGKRQGTSKHPQCKSMFYNNDLGLWLIEHCGKGFDNKIVPHLIFNSPRTVRLSYIYGVLEAEGNICTDANNKQIIRMEMNNDIFIRQLRILMSSCGIHSYYEETLNKDRAPKAFKLSIAKNTWSNLISMPPGPKSYQIKEAYDARVKTKKVDRENFDIVPLSPVIIKKIREIGKRMRTLTKQERSQVKLWRANNHGQKISLADHVRNDEQVYISRPMALNFLHTYGMFFEDDVVLLRWASIVKDASLMWELVKDITEVERESVLLDFTVPQGETFTTDNGLITHNTMTVHVPITDKAVRESYKMMPSRNLYKPGTGALMVGPSQESQLGFYLMSKDSKDREILNNILPPQFKIKGEMNKGESKALFLKLSKALPSDEFSKLIDTIKIMGENAAYEKGFTLSLNDLSVVPGRDKIVDAIIHESEKVKKGKISLQDFTKKVTGKNGFQDQLDKMIAKDMASSGNSLYQMVISGARGNKGQLRQIVASPLLVQNPQGETIPIPIKKSFTEGLDLSEYWVASYGARKGMIDRARGTQEPGVFNKSLMAVAVNNIITIDDCGTTEGINFPVNSPEILGRYIQGNQGGIPDETIISEHEVKKLKKANIKQVLVRSPLKCKAVTGTCRHCFGVDESGNAVSIGTNIGTKAGQSLAEPLTQMQMNTFHTGGIVGSGQKEGYSRIKELMDMPKNIKAGKAILAEESGIVKDIRPSGLGGYNVTINNKKYVTFPNLKLLIKKGDQVKKGDSLTEGSIAPQELLVYKGMDKVQEYLTDELKNAYKSQDINIDRKSFETIVRSLTNRTQVVNNVDGLDALPGDSIPYTVVEDYNKNRKMKIPTEQAHGLLLSKPVAGLNKGLKLSDKEIKMLKGLGIPQLNVEKEQLRHQPYIKGISSLPLSQNDWLAQMGATRITDAIINGASQGWMSELKGNHPIPAYAYGATFGDEDGTY